MMDHPPERCCICGVEKICFNNPEPLRDGSGQNCCDDCNLLVRAAREQIFRLPEEERAELLKKLPEMSREQLEERFGGQP